MPTLRMSLLIGLTFLITDLSDGPPLFSQGTLPPASQVQDAPATESDALPVEAQDAAATASASSVYWGAYIPNAPWAMDDLTRFETLVQKPVSLVHFGYPWKQNGAMKAFPTTQMEAIRQTGSIPVVGWGSWELGKGPDQPAFRLKNITAGRYDSYLRTWARAAKAWGHPFFLKFDWEMDGAWQFPWSVQLNGNATADFIPAWQHVFNIFKSVGATNVTWVWCPTTVSPVSVPLKAVYPGDAYVHWTCIHGYNFNNGRWLSFSDVFSGYTQSPYNSYQTLLTLAPTKPIMLGEWASAEAGDGGAMKAAWIRDAFQTQLPANYPRIKAVVWFNWNAHPDRTWTVDSSQPALDAFRESVALPAYATDTFRDLPAAPIQPLAP